MDHEARHFVHHLLGTVPLLEWTAKFVPLLMLALLGALLVLHRVLRRLGISVGSVSFRSLRNVTVRAGDTYVHIGRIWIGLGRGGRADGWWSLRVDRVTVHLPLLVDDDDADADADTVIMDVDEHEEAHAHHANTLNKSAKRVKSSKALIAGTRSGTSFTSTQVYRFVRQRALAFGYWLLARLLNGFAVRVASVVVCLGEDVVAARVGDVLLSCTLSSLTNVQIAYKATGRRMSDVAEEIAADVDDRFENPLLSIPSFIVKARGCVHPTFLGVDRTEVDLRVDHGIRVDLSQLATLKHSMDRHALAVLTERELAYMHAQELEELRRAEEERERLRVAALREAEEAEQAEEIESLFADYVSEHSSLATPGSDASAASTVSTSSGGSDDDVRRLRAHSRAVARLTRHKHRHGRRSRHTARASNVPDLDPFRIVRRVRIRIRSIEAVMPLNDQAYAKQDIDAGDDVDADWSPAALMDNSRFALVVPKIVVGLRSGARLTQSDKTRAPPKRVSSKDEYETHLRQVDIDAHIEPVRTVIRLLHDGTEDEYPLAIVDSVRLCGSADVQRRVWIAPDGTRPPQLGDISVDTFAGTVTVAHAHVHMNLGHVGRLMQLRPFAYTMYSTSDQLVELRGKRTERRRQRCAERAPKRPAPVNLRQLHALLPNEALLRMELLDTNVQLSTPIPDGNVLQGGTVVFHVDSIFVAPALRIPSASDVAGPASVASVPFSVTSGVVGVRLDLATSSSVLHRFLNLQKFGIDMEVTLTQADHGAPLEYTAEVMPVLDGVDVLLTHPGVEATRDWLRVSMQALYMAGTVREPVQYVIVDKLVQAQAALPSASVAADDAGVKLAPGMLFDTITLRTCIRNVHVAAYGPTDPDDAKMRGVHFQLGELNVFRIVSTGSSEPEGAAFRPGLVGCEIESIRLDAYEHPHELVTQELAPLRSSLTGALLYIPEVMVTADLSQAHRIVVDCAIEDVRIDFRIYMVYVILAAVRQAMTLAAHIRDETMHGKEEVVLHSTRLPPPPPPPRRPTGGHRGMTPPLALQASLAIRSIDVAFHMACGIDTWIEIRDVVAHADNDRGEATLASLHLLGKNPAGEDDPHVPVISLHRVKASKSLTIPESAIRVAIDKGRLCQPDRYRLGDIFEHLNNTIKAIKVVVSRVLDGCDPAYSTAHILLPAISAQIHEFFFELEDDAFESRLTRNYRFGLKEQQERLARTDALELKLDMLTGQDAGGAGAGKTKAPSSRALTASGKATMQAKINAAWNAVRAYDSQSWIKKIDRVALQTVSPPPLFRLYGYQLAVNIGPPDFGVLGAPAVISSMDGCTPLDFQYDLLVPLHLSVSAQELSVRLRDLETPLALFPRSSTSSAPAFSLQGDLIIQEQYPEYFAFRYVDVNVVDNVIARVGRTISPVKIYSNLRLKVACSEATRVTFGPAMSPILDEVGIAFSRLGQPPPDLSPPLGFWDKLPLTMHGTLRVEWADNAELRFNLRGGMDPYATTPQHTGLEISCRGINVDVGGTPRVVEFACGDIRVGIPGDRSKGVDLEKCLFKSSGVELGLGVSVERKDGAQRLPHYMVKTRTAAHAEPGHDSFALFRTDYVHADVGVMIGGTDAQNSVHVSLRAITLLQRIFDTFTCPPIKFGSLYPRESEEADTPGLGQHLKTLRAEFNMEPFACALVHRQPKIGVDIGEPILVGIKLLVQSLNAKCFLRRRPKQGKSEAHAHASDETELVLDDAVANMLDFDLRIIGTPLGLNLEAEKLEEVGLRSDADSIMSTDSSDLGWHDDDDYAELGLEPISADLEDVHVEPMVWAPRTTYYSQMPDPDADHVELFATEKDSDAVQIDLLTIRMHELDVEIGEHEIRAQILDHNMGAQADLSDVIKEELDTLRSQIESLREKKAAIEKRIRKMTLSSGFAKRLKLSANEGCVDAEQDAVFSHGVAVHNANIIWSIPARNAIYRLTAYQEQYMALNYYMSTSAVKVLRNLRAEVKESSTNALSAVPTAVAASKDAVEEMIRQITGETTTSTSVEATTTVSSPYVTVNNFAMRLLHPQFRLQTSVDASSMIYLVSDSISLHSTSIIDPGFENDDTNEEIKMKITVNVKDLQLLLAFRTQFEEAHFGYSSFDYGVGPGGLWPVWVPLEILVDHEGEPGLFQRMVGRTSAGVTYEKVNPLRIAHTENTVFQSAGQELSDRLDRADLISVQLPQLALILDPDQFQEILTISTELMVYKEPVAKERLEQIKSVMMSADAGEFGDVAEFVVGLQEKIRSLRRIVTKYEAKVIALNDQQIADFASVSQQVVELENYLYVVMEGVNRSQNQADKSKDAQRSVRFSMVAEEVFWLMLMENREPLCQTSIKGASLSWIMNEDNSSVNTLEIVYLNILNRLPNSPFAEVLQPYTDNRRASIDFTRKKMVRVLWKELAPVAGIQVVEHFEVNMHPLKLQLTYDIGKQLVNYFFPDSKKAAPTRASEDASSRAADRKVQGGSASSARKASTMDGATLAVDTGSSGGGDGGDRRTGTSILTGVQVHQSISTMKSRASENRTYIYIKVPSFPVNLSYRGAKEKNIEDIYGFVFTFPTFEYRNKIWTTKDIVEQVKKDMIGTVFSHTGALLQQKLFRSNKVQQQQQQQMLATASADAAADEERKEAGAEADEAQHSDNSQLSDAAETSTLRGGDASQKGKAKSLILNNLKRGTQLMRDSMALLQLDKREMSDTEKLHLLFGDLYRPMQFDTDATVVA